MDALTRIGWIGLIALVLAVSGCGGGGGGDGGGGGTSQSGTVIDAAGGTVVGPNGAKVVIPAGALATDTTINIAQIAASTAVLPAGFSVSGQIFAFTPHGTQFAVPVTMTLPFNPALVPAGITPQFYKTNAQFQWEQIANATFGADTASAQVTSFSDAAVVIPPLVRGEPIREWSFGEYRGDALEFVELNADIQVGGLLNELFDFGPTSRDGDVFDPDGTSLPSDGIATGQISSSASGETFWVGAEAPSGNANLPNDPVGGFSDLTQTQSFIKRADDAKLTFILSAAFIEATDRNGIGFGRRCPAAHADGLLCDLIKGELRLDVQAFTVPAAPNIVPFNTFFHVAGGATLEGFAGSWDSSTWTPPNSQIPIWGVEDFDFVIDTLEGAPEGLVLMILRNPRTFTVDLSSIAVGQAFTLQTYTYAIAYNRIAGPPQEAPSSVSAFLRDRQSSKGMTVTFTGLEPTDSPVLIPPVDAPIPPAACVPGPGPDAAAGTLQFSAANYIVAEASTTPTITVTRTGGSKGAVTATFSTSNGTAIAGTDYRAVNTSVFFADGDATQRVVEIPIIQDLISGEPDKTVNLALSQPGGCAALGTRTTAALMIRDDDVPPVINFTIGGTVTGLVGTGLVLNKLGEDLPIAANGAFTFKQAQSTGFSYSVTVITQPTNPLQLCTVTNGSGPPPTANITNIAVNCVTPAANGALDPTFGDGGKVSTAFGGDETAMALQADGKIVMAGGSGSDFVLARYNANGSLDAGFGSGGLVTTDFLSNVTGNEAHGVAIQSDGKIVVVGFAVVGLTPKNLSNFDFALARYNSNGTLDASFGTGGKVTTDFNGVADRAFAVAIQTDGKIVVAGDVGFDTPSGVGAGADFGLARYNADGTLDSSFGSAGKLTTDIAGGIDIAHNVIVLQGNGAILVSGAGTTAGDAGLDHTGLARYDTNGVLDGSFGTGGKLTLIDKRVDEGLVLQGDGKILLAGSVSIGIFPARSSQFALMRLLANGGPDNSFGTAGLVTTPFSTLDDFGRAVALQADGRILVAGQRSNQSNPDFAVARYATDGTLDGSFGTGGKLTIEFFGSFDGAENVVVQPDGKIVLGGFARNGTRTGYGLARVLP